MEELAVEEVGMDEVFSKRRTHTLFMVIRQTRYLFYGKQI